MMHLLQGPATGLLLLFYAAGSLASEPWYSEDQRTAGERLFTAHCQECHGRAGEGTPDWQKRGADGKFPPPPLNGSAHTWHHSPEVLLRTLLDGGQALGGSMPGFRDKLGLQEMTALIAYLNSLWPAEIYELWLNAYPEAVQLPREAPQE